MGWVGGWAGEEGGAVVAGVDLGRLQGWGGSVSRPQGSGNSM